MLCEETVLRGDVLELTVGPVGSEPVFKDGCLVQLPAKAFHVAVLALLLSCACLAVPFKLRWRLLLLGPAGRAASLVERQSTGTGQQQLVPWEVNRYIMANYHKAGVFLTKQMLFLIFSSIGASAFCSCQCSQGLVEYPCYNICNKTNAPIREFTDNFNKSLAELERKKSSKRLLIAGMVRDPLEMERGNQLFPVWDLMKMGHREGTQLCAERLLPLVEWMADTFAQPDPETLRIDYETITSSSGAFDAEVLKLLEHYFGAGEEFITAEQRQRILWNTQVLDLNRYPNNSNTMVERGGKEHKSNEECVATARSAVMLLDGGLLRKFQALQQKLGYRVWT
eukprot:g9188.t1